MDVTIHATVRKKTRISIAAQKFGFWSPVSIQG